MYSLLLRALLLLMVVASLGCSKKNESATADESAAQAEGDVPAPPQSAPPAEAPAADGTDDRPPHPAIPDPLEEAQPSAATLASTTYRWLPGHWFWTGSQYEWQEGLWVYDVPGFRMVRPRWEWDGKQWVFHDAGWAAGGSTEVVYRPTEVPADGSADEVPVVDEGDLGTDVYAEADDATYYYWGGRYLPPPIVYPRWHPHHHYHHHNGHSRYSRAPSHDDSRYEHARRNDYRNDPPVEKHRDRVWDEPSTPRHEGGRIKLGIDGDPGYVQQGQPGSGAPAPEHRNQTTHVDPPPRQPSHAEQAPRPHSDPNRPPPAPAHHPPPAAGPHEGPKEPGPNAPPPARQPAQPRPHGGPHR